MRIVTQEELDKAIVFNQIGRWREEYSCNSCVAMHVERDGCSTECVSAGTLQWFWHGLTGERPTPESILTLNGAARVTQCADGHLWKYRPTDSLHINAVHARAATLAAAINGEYDEDTERARLVAVPA